MSGIFRPGIDTGLPPKMPYQTAQERESKRLEQKSDDRYAYSLGLDALRQSYENQSRGVYNNIQVAEALAQLAALQAQQGGAAYGLQGDGFQSQVANARLRGDLASTRVNLARMGRGSQQELLRAELDDRQRRNILVPNDFMEVTRGFQ